jgi:hypothetical protein
MKIIKDLIEKMNDTLEEIEWYGEKAMHIKAEYKATADTFIDVADMHVKIYGMLHDRAVKLIEEQKSKGVEVPKEMQIIWDYKHQDLVKDFAKAKFMIEEYKKSNY